MKKWKVQNAYAISFAIHAALMSLFLFQKAREERIEISFQSDSTSPVSSHSVSAGSLRFSSKSRVKTTNYSDPQQAPLLADAPSEIEKQQFESYVDQLRIRILAHQHYPLKARKQNMEGRVEMRIKIDSEGRLIEKNVIFPGKNIILESAALDAVEAASPFPRLPKGFLGDFRIPIEFHLKKE